MSAKRLAEGFGLQPAHEATLRSPAFAAAKENQIGEQWPLFQELDMSSSKALAPR
jgi:hypothetical protein